MGCRANGAETPNRIGCSIIPTCSTSNHPTSSFIYLLDDSNLELTTRTSNKNTLRPCKPNMTTFTAYYFFTNIILHTFSNLLQHHLMSLDYRFFHRYSFHSQLLYILPIFFIHHIFLIPPKLILYL
jgi:hypothetical protein